MKEVYIVHNNENIDKVMESTDSVTFNYIDIGTKKGKKEGWAIKNKWGSRSHPFALVVEDDRPIRAFYSEAEDVLTNLKKYLNGEID